MRLKVSFAFIILGVILLGIGLLSLIPRNPGSITGHQIAGGGALASNTLTLRNDDSSAFTNYPIQIGRAFVQGEVLSGDYPQALIDGTPVQTQVDVKNRYSDNSLKFAIISFILPSLSVGQTKTVSFQSISSATYQSTVGTTALSTSAMLANYDFDAVTELVNPASTQSISARTMLSNGNIESYWLQGPIVTSIVLADHSTNRAYDLGWKQQRTILLSSINSSDTVFSVDNASWISAGQTLNLNDELVSVVSVNTNANPDTITVTRSTGGLPADSVILGDRTSIFLTSTTWQTTTNNSEKSFRPLFEVDFWPSTLQTKVRFIGENSNTESLQDLYYDLNLKTSFISPTTIYSQTNITHFTGARWAKEFWIGGTPSKKLTIDHNRDYLARTGFVDYYAPEVQPSPTAVSTWYSTFNSATQGIFKLFIFTYTEMGPGGSRSELSRIPLWDALWLNNFDYRMQELVMAVADHGASWPVHYREGNANKKFDRVAATGALGTLSGLGKPISPNARPSLAIVSPYWNGINAGDKMNYVSRFTHGGANNPIRNGVAQNWDTSKGHYYNLYSTAYLLYGRHFDYEELLFWSSYSTLIDGESRGPVAGAQGGKGGALMSPWGERYEGRSMYVRIPAATFAIDGTPEKEHFTNMVTDAIVAWMGMHNIPLSQESTIANTQWNIDMWNYGHDQFTNPGNTFSNPDLPSPLNFWIYGSPGCANPVDVTSPTAPQFCAIPWMYSTIVEALGKADELGYPVGSLMNYTAGYYHWHFNTQGFDPNFMGSYREPSTDSNGAPLQTPAQVASYYTAAYQANPCSISGLPGFCGNNLVSDSYALQHYASSTRIYAYDPTPYTFMYSKVQGTLNGTNDDKDPRFALAPRPLSVSCTPNQNYNCISSYSGICSPGTYQCNSNGDGYTTCNPNIAPNSQTETCNGLDDDCDSIIDEGCSCSFFNGVTCSSGQFCSNGVFLSQASTSMCCGAGGTCITPQIPTGLVAAYTFSEGNGTTVADSSGNGNDGTLVGGPTWSLGKYDNGIVFDGLNDYISVPSSSTLNPTSQVSLTAWLFDPNSTGGIIVGKAYLGDQYHLRSVNSKFRFRINGGLIEINPSVTFTPGWHHVAATYDGVDLRVYYDGVLIGTPLASNAALITTTQPLVIGARFNATGTGLLNFYDGEIDEVRVYNHGLSAGEVVSDMVSAIITNNPINPSTPAPPSNLQASSSGGGGGGGSGTGGVIAPLPSSAEIQPPTAPTQASGVVATPSSNTPPETKSGSNSIAGRAIDGNDSLLQQLSPLAIYLGVVLLGLGVVWFIRKNYFSEK